MDGATVFDHMNKYNASMNSFTGFDNCIFLLRFTKSYTPYLPYDILWLSEVTAVEDDSAIEDVGVGIYHC